MTEYKAESGTKGMLPVWLQRIQQYNDDYNLDIQRKLLLLVLCYICFKKMSEVG